MKTAKGYLKKRGKVYYACWQANGRRYAQSTGKTNQRDAQAELKRLIAPFKAVDEAETLKAIARRIEGSESENQRHHCEMNPPLLLSHGWLRFMASPNRPDSGPGTLRMYEGQFKAFNSWMQKENTAAVAFQDVTADIAEAYAGHLTRRGLSGNTYNKHIRLLEMVFSVLSKPACLTVNPWANISRKRVVSDSRRELTVAELKAVCEAATGELRMLFGIGIYTGLRLGDAATLRWGEVDLHRGFIRRIPNKTGRRNSKPVIVPIHAVLAMMLEEIPPEDRGEYLLPECARLYLSDKTKLSYRVQKHFEDCDLTTTKPGTGGDTGRRAVVEVGFHSLRHTFVSLCREADVPLAVVESIVGHSNPSMTRHYTHVGEHAAGTAVAGLPSVMGGDLKALPPPQESWRERVRGIADGLNSKTWRQTKDALLQLVDEDDGNYSGGNVA